MRSESFGASKSFDTVVSTPPEVIENVAESTPASDHVTVSFAVKVKTEVVFSVIDIELVAPIAEFGPVIIGATSAVNLTITTPDPPLPPNADDVRPVNTDPPPPPPPSPLVPEVPAFPELLVFVRHVPAAPPPPFPPLAVPAQIPLLPVCVPPPPPPA